MYSHDGHDIFVVDGHMHFWDANPENWKTKHGESWIKCFHAFHSGLSPAEEVWAFDKFCCYGEEVLVNDLFRTGYVSMSSTRTASILTCRTTSSRPSIRTAFYCAAPSIRGTKRPALTRFAK